MILAGNKVLSQAEYNYSDLWLPDTIFLAKGNSIEIYNDNIAFLRSCDTLVSFRWEHNAGISDSSGFSWTADKTGNMNLKVKMYLGDELIGSACTILKVEEKASGRAYNLLAIGNSLTRSGFSEQYDQASKDLDIDLNPIGTQGTTVRHEGRGGWRFDSFLGKESPFFFNDTISLKKYVKVNNFPDPEIFKISLGINDCYGKLPMDTIFNNAFKLIDIVHHDYPDALIIVALPSSCEKTGSGWISSYGSMMNFERYQVRIRKLWKVLYDKYAYGKFHRNIQISFDGLVIDRTNGYPKNNGVHPNPGGYRQLSWGFSNTLNHYIRNHRQ
jgi:hypothetical protein